FKKNNLNPHYFNRRNLTFSFFFLAIFFTSIISFFIFKKILRNYYLKRSEEDCLNQVMVKTKTLQEGLCVNGGFTKNCNIEKLNGKDIDLFVNFYETNSNNCKKLNKSN
ncbi:hypothetical protein GYA19_03485, partial [Candidatus Beckwithbacteria bacterium]|nr:hypothetical protein [Candidatus Beckwithbacteria bacterium]